MLVVGKIIIDEYGSPTSLKEARRISIGGGGPQAAWGAAAAYAILVGGSDDHEPHPLEETVATTLSRVTLIAPVGNDWIASSSDEVSMSDTDRLREALPPGYWHTPLY